MRRRVEPFTVVSFIGVSAFAIVCLIPFWMILAGSFTSESKLSVSGYSLFPKPFSLDAYETIFTGPAVLSAYRTSAFITIVTYNSPRSMGLCRT